MLYVYKKYKWNRLYFYFIFTLIVFLLYKILTKAPNDLMQSEITYREQEVIWHDLQQARNDLERPKKTYNDQEITWKDLKRSVTNRFYLHETHLLEK